LEHVELVHAVVVPHCPVVGSHCWTPLPLHRVWFGAHVPVHKPPRHVWLAHPTGVFQLPFAPQSCDELPTHWLVPGEHATQLLLRHAGVAPEQVVWVCQVPFAVQDWMLLPRHSVCPGAQTPVHAPATHVMLEQGLPLVHVPLALHVCGALAEQLVCPGAHWPVQLPEMHVWLMQGAGAPHAPFMSHVSTPLA
jgi:hypothetical protein